jgi:hypothetical protein
MSTDDPDVYLKGMGTMPLSMVKKLVKFDLQRFADRVGMISSKELLSVLTDVEGNMKSSPYGNFAYRIRGLAEVEDFMNRPETKRKISMMKKKSGIV